MIIQYILIQIKIIYNNIHVDTFYLFVFVLQAQRSKMLNQSSEQEKSYTSQSNQSPMQNDRFAQLLYSSRIVNDKLFDDIIKQTARNHVIQQQLQKQKQKIPVVIQKWCSKDNGLNTMKTFMLQFSRLLNDQINSITDRLDTYKKQKELLSIQQQKQTEQNAQFVEKVRTLQEQLKRITLRNDQLQQELKQCHNQKKTIMNQVRQYEHRKHFLNMQKDIKNYQIQKIMAATKIGIYEDAQYKYFQELTSLINHIHQRKIQIHDKEKHMKEEIERLNKLIDELKQEKEGAQRKRSEIVNKHRQLLTLKAELAKIQEKRAKAVKEKNALQQKYCENYMTEVVACYHGLDQKYSCLVNRTMNLIKIACGSLDIQQVNRRIEQMSHQPQQ